MAKKAAKEDLSRSLSAYITTIEDTLQLLNDEAPPPSSLQKVPWNEVTALAQHISKQATLAGMLWTGAAPDLKDLEDSMSAYFEMLQGFLLLSNGSTIGAGPTLRSCIHASAKNIVNCSVSLLKEAVSSYEKILCGGSVDKRKYVAVVLSKLGFIYERSREEFQIYQSLSSKAYLLTMQLSPLFPFISQCLYKAYNLDAAAAPEYTKEDEEHGGDFATNPSRKPAHQESNI